MRNRAKSATDERDLTARLVGRVVPPIVDSLILVGRGGAQSRASTSEILADAKRLTINLLIFFAAARQGHIPRATQRKGMRIVKEAASPTSPGLAKQANVHVVDEFVSRSAARGWERLAPRHAVATKTSIKSVSRAALLQSNKRLMQALLALFDRDGSEPWQEAVPGFTTRVLGSLHELLLGRRLKFVDGQARLIEDKNNRRKSGSFYTPEPLVRVLVEKTVGPVLRRRIQEIAKPRNAAAADEAKPPPFGFTLLDPAMGSGHFLTAALDYSAEQINRASQKYKRPASEMASQIVAMPLRKPRRNTAIKEAQAIDEDSTVKQILLAHSIFGADTDADTVELARLSLWLESGLPASGQERVVQNLITGDSLLSKDTNKSRPCQFDAIVGNPPYGTPDATYRQRLRSVLPQTRHNADLAAAFVERSLELIAPGGQIGLVLPKPLTYSFAWRHLRQTLQHQTAWICDIRRGWEQVLAEQVLLVVSGHKLSRDTHQVGVLKGPRSRALPNIPRSWSERFGVLLSSLTTEDCQRLGSMQFAQDTVGDLCRTFRGLPWQRQLRESGDQPVFGGRDLERWSLRSTSGYTADDPQDPRLKDFAQPKLLFQNIIAHIENPKPHVRLIGTFDSQQSVTLDTVNNLVARQPEVHLKAVLALLHSATVNWLVYSVVYNRAIRTMHFDQYFLNKIPLPLGWDRVQSRLAELAEDCLTTTSQLKSPPEAKQPTLQTTQLVAKLATAQAEIDRVTARAYSDRGCHHRG